MAADIFNQGVHSPDGTELRGERGVHGDEEPVRRFVLEVLRHGQYRSTSSHGMHQTNGFRKSTTPQSRQFII